MTERTRRFTVSFGSMGAKELDREIQAADKSLAELEGRGKSVAKTLEQASKTTEQAESAVVAAARKNAERRIRLIEDESARRAQLLELRQRRELELARRRGESLTELTALHQRQQAELDAKVSRAAERQAERKAKTEEAARRRRRDAELADAKARARALEDAGQRQIALLDVKHQQELERARRQGQKLEALQVAQARERAEAVKRIEDKAAAAARASRALANGLGDVDRRLDGVDRSADDATQALARLEQRTVTVARSLRGVGGAAATALAAVSAGRLLDLAEEGAGLQLITHRLADVGVSAEQVADIMNRLGGGSTSAVELLVSRANEAGIAFEDMGSLADTALQLASARGLDTNEVMQKLTEAVAGGETGWLKSQGIIIDVAAAQRAYAASVGRTAAQLSEQEKIAATSQEIVSELNRAFAGEAPDKYASNIGAVRDRLNNLADVIKRKLADALSDLGAVLSGGLFGASFASENKGTRAQQIEKQVKQLEDAERRLASAAEKGASAVADTVLALRSELGQDVFTAMMGLPADHEVTRITAAYIGAQDRVVRQLVTAREQLDIALIDEYYAEVEANEPDDDTTKPVKRFQDLNAWLAQNVDAPDDGLFERLAAIEDSAQVELPWVGALLELQSVDLVAKLGEVNALAAGIAAAKGRDERRRAELDGDDMRLFDELRALEERQAAERSLAMQHGDDLALITEVYEERRTQAVEAAARRRLAAQLAEVQATAGNVEKLGRAAHSLAKTVGASRGVLAGIDRVMELARAAREVAAGIGKGAAGDVVGAGAHFVAAAAHTVAAAKFGSVPGGGGGGGGSGAPAAPQYSRASSTPTAADLPRERNAGGQGGSSTVIHIYGATDPRGARDTIADHQDQRGYGEVRYETGAA